MDVYLNRLATSETEFFPCGSRPVIAKKLNVRIIVWECQASPVDPGSLRTPFWSEMHIFGANTVPCRASDGSFYESVVTGTDGSLFDCHVAHMNEHFAPVEVTLVASALQTPTPPEHVQQVYRPPYQQVDEDTGRITAGQLVPVHIDEDADMALALHLQMNSGGLGQRLVPARLTRMGIFSLILCVRVTLLEY